MPHTALLLFVLLVHLTGAGSACEVELAALFRDSARAFENCGVCVEDVRGFARRVRDSGISLAGARVLYLRRADLGLLTPDASRQGAGARYRHHTVLEIDGRIYDFSFTAAPRPVDTATYFREMFATDAARDRALRERGAPPESEVHVIAIPAADAAETNLPRPFGDYPVTTLLNFLPTISGTRR